MSLQEMIQAIIDKVRWLVRDNEAARKIVAAKDDIKVVLKSNENGEFEVGYIRFVGSGGRYLYVYQHCVLLVTNILLVNDDDVVGTQLFGYNSFDELLKLQN